MRVVCAWCKQEGRDVALGTREPVDDTTETHGICARHSEEMLEQLPSVTFPGIRVLFVVRRTEIDLYHYLARSLEGLPDVAAILDRRRGERRKRPAGVAIERRRANRRVRKAEFSGLGYLVVRFGPQREAWARATVEPLKPFPVRRRRSPE